MLNYAFENLVPSKKKGKKCIAKRTINLMNLLDALAELQDESKLLFEWLDMYPKLQNTICFIKTLTYLLKSLKSYDYAIGFVDLECQLRLRFVSLKH